MMNWLWKSTLWSSQQEYDLVGRETQGQENLGIEMPELSSPISAKEEREEELPSQLTIPVEEEIEMFSSDFESSERMMVARCSRSCRRCGRLFCLVCECAVVIFILALFAGAYIGGLLPRWHLPKKNCPHIGNHKNRLTSVLDLNLNRQARLLSSEDLEWVNGSNFGFVWNHGDNSTNKWRPQGITTVNIPLRSDDPDHQEGRSDGFVKFILVSWYGRTDQNYFDRGGRISFVRLETNNSNNNNTTNSDTLSTSNSSKRTVLRYRHVLLVDKNWSPIPFLHVGGLAIDRQTNKLHVPDSRYPWNYNIRVFDIVTSLYAVPPCHSERFFGYGYVVKQDSSYGVPIKPSFLSFAEPDQILTGSYAHTCKNKSMHTDLEDCRRNSENRLAWMGIGKDKQAPPLVCTPFFSEMQGAAFAEIKLNSQGNNTGGRKVLWISSSYGGKRGSHLHTVVDFDPQLNCTNGKLQSGNIEAFDVTTFIFPPGMEDLCIDKGAKSLWSLTEFGSRRVFQIPFESVLPPPAED